MNQNFFLHGKLFKLKFKIFNTLQKGHFWTFPPCNFLPFVKIPVFGLFSPRNFQHLAKNSKHASFWTFFPAQCLVGRHKFAKLQICVLTKIKRTSKIQSMLIYKFAKSVSVQLVLALVLRVDTVSHQGMWCPPSHALQPAQPGSELLELPKGVGRPLLIST